MCQPLVIEDGAEVASHKVSEDGVHWRPFNPAMDQGRLLHKRIKFAPPSEAST